MTYTTGGAPHPTQWRDLQPCWPWFLAKTRSLSPSGVFLRLKGQTNEPDSLPPSILLSSSTEGGTTISFRLNECRISVGRSVRRSGESGSSKWQERCAVLFQLYDFGRRPVLSPPTGRRLSLNVRGRGCANIFSSIPPVPVLTQRKRSCYRCGALCTAILHVAANNP